MPDRIKGITVEIGGDTTDLSQSLRTINQESRAIGSELSDVQRLLKFNPESAELLAQRQTLLNRQIETTSQRLTELRSVEHQVQQQFERGDLGEDQFRAFQREIIATEGRLQHFERQAQGSSRNVRGAFKELGKGMAAGIGAAVAGAGINEIVQKSLETAHMETQIKIGFQVPEEQVGKVKEIVTSVQAYGVETEAAMEGVRRQFALNIDKTTEQNEAIVKGAAAITQAYSGIDFNELIQETNEMAGSMDMTQEDALAMTNALLKMGFPPDQLDIITEYGAQLKMAGYNASEIQGIMAAGVDTKSWNIDKLLDGIKEGRIRLAQFGVGVDKTTAGLIKGTNISTQELQKWGEAVAEGGDAGKVAMGEVALNLSKIQDDTQRNAIGVRLFGTMWEDTGKKLTDTMINSSKYAGDAKKNQDLLNQSVKTLDADPQVQLNKAIGDMTTALTPLLVMVADWVGKLASWASKNPEIASSIIAITVGLGILIGLISAAAGVVAILDAAALALDVALAPLILGMLAWIAVIAAVIAIGVLLYKNWDTIVAKAKKDWNELVEGVKTMGRKIKEHFNEAVQDIKEIWGKVTKFFKGIDLSKLGSDIMNGLKKGIANAAEGIYKKAGEIAGKVIKTLKNAFKSKSPSRITQDIGNDVGEGLLLGMEESIRPLQYTSIDMANAVIGQLTSLFDDKYNAVTAYFEAIQEDGDWLNDMLTHMPRQVAAIARQVGQALAPDLEGTRKQDFQKDWDGNNKYITVTLNSPKALDVREANRQFSSTMNKMALMW